MKIISTRYLCPFCGQWHDEPLKDNRFYCSNNKNFYGMFLLFERSKKSFVSLFEDYKDEDKICYDYSEIIPLEDLTIDSNNHRVLYKLEYEKKGSCNCSNCGYSNYCTIYNKTSKDNHIVTINLAFDFNAEEFDKHFM